MATGTPHQRARRMFACTGLGADSAERPGPTGLRQTLHIVSRSGWLSRRSLRRVGHRSPTDDRVVFRAGQGMDRTACPPTGLDVLLPDVTRAGAPHDVESRDRPLVAVIILNWNGGEWTVRCAESVLASAYDRFFVIVVDNGSTDRSAALISRWVDERSKAARSAMKDTAPPPISFLRLDSNRGYGAGNNAGIARALEFGADAVWVLNNDTTVDRRAMGHLVDSFNSDARAGLVGACILNPGDPATVQCLGGGTYGRWTSRARMVAAGQAPGLMINPDRLDYVSGASIFLGRRCIEEVGGFEEGYFLYCEEIDLARRAAAAGWHMAVAHRAIVWHVGGATVGSDADLSRRSSMAFYFGARSATLLARKFSPPAVLTVVVARAAFAVSLVIRRRRAAARAVATGVISGLSVRSWSRSPRFPGSSAHGGAR